ncbi:MAG: N-acetylmuramoyl-L-alanine amidase-like domain-containing protein [Bacteroidota bacterium]
MKNSLAKTFLLLVFFSYFSIIPSFHYSQSVYTQRDVEICNSKFQLAVDQELSKKSINEIIVDIAKSFIGTDYAANTLEVGDKEKLVINLTGLDCYTFLESAIVFARLIKNGSTTFEDYQKELINIRYRGGKLNEYPSRLHYFSDWIYDIDKRGIGKNITKDIGGVGYMKKIDFMTTHTDAYRQLKENPNFVEEIRNTERKMSFRKNFYIPEDEIEKIEEKIQSGDILGITTNIEGLDISHTGIAIRMDDGRIHLLHAPNIGYKVQISEKPLADYLKANKKQTGVMVLRINSQF